MPKVFTSRTQRTGEFGEKIAAIYLQNKGFSIIERNYTKKWGEIDIIARKGTKLHFVEVKAIKVNSAKTKNYDEYRPEFNMHAQKLSRVYRTVATYLIERRYTGDWQIDLIAVRLNDRGRSAEIECLPNLIA